MLPTVTGQLSAASFFFAGDRVRALFLILATISSKPVVARWGELAIRVACEYRRSTTATPSDSYNSATENPVAQQSKTATLIRGVAYPEFS